MFLGPLALAQKIGTLGAMPWDSPEKRKSWRQRPEVKARARARQTSPEYLARQKEYKRSAAYKAKRNASGIREAERRRAAERQGKIYTPRKQPHSKTGKKALRQFAGTIRDAAKREKQKRSFKIEATCKYTLEQLRTHLRRTIPPGFRWADFVCGDLHLDHIKPLAAFPSTASHREVNALSNLRLIPARENKSRCAGPYGRRPSTTDRQFLLI